MKQVKDFNGEVIKAEEGSPIQPFHAYISLMLGMLKEPHELSQSTDAT